MPDVPKTRDALWEAKISLRHLEFAIRLEGYCNRVPKPDTLPRFLDEINIPHSCLLPEGTITYDNPFSEQELKRHAAVSISVAFGVSAQILNKAYEQACIKVVSPPTDYSKAVRLYINQVRNLFQHSAGAPTWDIVHKKQVAIELNVDGNKLHVDFTTLQGKEFDYSQIGGLRYWLDAASFAMGDITNAIT